jgi:hypothetical protein
MTTEIYNICRPATPKYKTLLYKILVLSHLETAVFSGNITLSGIRQEDQRTDPWVQWVVADNPD